MKVYLYSGMQHMIEKSGVGRAIYHQKSAARQNHIQITQTLENADAVHINTVFPMSFELARKAKRLGIPVVYHAHSTREDFKNSYIGSNLLAPLFGKWIKWCYNMGTVIVTPTEYSKKLLLSYGIKKPIEAVSNGIDTEFYNRIHVNKMTFREKYGYSEKDKIIMSAGLMIERKGIVDFVELAKRMPQYQFIWFGETNLNIVPKKIRKAVCMELPNLKFAGYVKPEELREAYGSCDLFLFPSKEETEGIVVLEALAMKIPVLLRKIPVYEDWLVENQDVYKGTDIEDFENKAQGILEGKLPNLAEAGHLVAEERSLDKVGRKLSEIYENCMNSKESVGFALSDTQVL